MKEKKKKNERIKAIFPWLCLWQECLEGEEPKQKLLFNSKLTFSEEVTEGSTKGGAPHSWRQKTCLNVWRVTSRASVLFRMASTSHMW